MIRRSASNASSRKEKTGDLNPVLICRIRVLIT